jgi:hypothetical protein
MKTRWMIFATLLLAGSWVVAQDTGTSSPSPQTGTSNSSTVGQTGSTPDQNSNVDTGNAGQVTPGSASIQGCLTGSASSGKYALTDEQSGVIYTLVGSTETLRNLVGNEVQLQGEATSGSMGSSSMGSETSAQTGAMSGSSTGTANAGGTDVGKIFQVGAASKIADQCGSVGGKSGPTGALGNDSTIFVAELTPAEFPQSAGSAGSAGTAGARTGQTGSSPSGQTGTPGTAGQTSPSTGTTNGGMNGSVGTPGTATGTPGTATPPPGTATPMPGTTTAPVPGETPNSGNPNSTPGTTSNPSDPTDPNATQPNGGTATPNTPPQP